MDVFFKLMLAIFGILAIIVVLIIILFLKRPFIFEISDDKFIFKYITPLFSSKEIIVKKVKNIYYYTKLDSFSGKSSEFNYIIFIFKDEHYEIFTSIPKKVIHHMKKTYSKSLMKRINQEELSKFVKKGFFLEKKL